MGGRLPSRAAACPSGIKSHILYAKSCHGRATGGRLQCVSASATLYEKHNNFCLRTPIGPIFGGMKLDFHI